MSFKEHAILNFVLRNKSQVLCKNEYVSYHTTISHLLITYIEWGPYDSVHKFVGILAGNKSIQTFNLRRI
jgi:hypothetical protein